MASASLLEGIGLGQIWFAHIAEPILVLQVSTKMYGPACLTLQYTAPKDSMPSFVGNQVPGCRAESPHTLC